MRLSFHNSLTAGIYSLLSIFYGMSLALIVLITILLFYSLGYNLPFNMPLQPIGITLEGPELRAFFIQSKQDFFLQINNAELIFVDKNTLRNLLTGLSALSTFIIFFSLVRLLRKIVLSIRTNNVFCPSNIQRVKYIGLLMITGWLLVNALNLIYYYAFISDLYLKHIQFRFQPVGGWAVFDGLLILVLANVFRVGNKMQNEIELTV